MLIFNLEAIMFLFISFVARGLNEMHLNHGMKEHFSRTNLYNKQITIKVEVKTITIEIVPTQLCHLPYTRPNMKPILNLES